MLVLWRISEEVETKPMLSGVYLYVLIAALCVIASVVCCALILNFCPRCRQPNYKYLPVAQGAPLTPEHAAALQHRKSSGATFPPQKIANGRPTSQVCNQKSLRLKNRNVNLNLP